MTLLSIDATFECEGCGKPFSVMLPNDACTAENETLFELAEARLRDGWASNGPSTGLCSYLAQTILCPKCTAVIFQARLDSSNPDGIQPLEKITRQWILTRLGCVSYSPALSGG